MRHSVIAVSYAALGLFMLTGCQQDRPEPAVDAGPLYVYSSYADVDYLPALFQRFTQDTGIHVVVRHRSDAENLKDMRDKSGSQPADVLFTSSVWSAWLAADDGLLRPLAADSAVTRVEGFLRDADNLWVGVSIDPLVIVGEKTSSTDAAGFSYADLAAPPFAGKLCLTSSTFSHNRILIAMLMDALGDRQAELLVRKWMRNLALPPREKESDLGLSDPDSACDYAITRLSTLQSSNQAVLLSESPVFFDIEAMGIGRHAQHPEAAQMLIDWMLTRPVNEAHARQRHMLPIDVSAQRRLPGLKLARQQIATAGFRYTEAEKLAERARYP